MGGANCEGGCSIDARVMRGPTFFPVEARRKKPAPFIP